MRSGSLLQAMNQLRELADLTSIAFSDQVQAACIIIPSKQLWICSPLAGTDVNELYFSLNQLSVPVSHVA